MTTKPLTRTVTLKFSDGPAIGEVVWTNGMCTVITYVEARREPRLDCNSQLAIDQLAWAIEHGDPSGQLEFLWDDYLTATDR